MDMWWPGLTSHPIDWIITYIVSVRWTGEMSAYPVTLVFADGASCTVEMEAGQNVVQAFADHGYNLLTDCSEGRCGTCMARLLTGTVDLGSYDDQTLLDDDRAAGMILPCVASAVQPCVIELPYDFAEVTAENIQLRGVVSETALVAAEVAKLTIDLEEPLDFLPGQYVRITPSGHSFTRSYSMANRPGERRAEFYVRLVDGGAFSTWLTKEATPGLNVSVSRPHGSFFLRNEPRPRLFVAGGTGLAPFISMLRVLTDTNSVEPTKLLIGARTEDHLFCRMELAEFVEAIPQLRIDTIVEQAATATVKQGFATDAISPGTYDSDARPYLCGPPPMVEAGRKALASFKVAPSDILCERFT